MKKAPRPLSTRKAVTRYGNERDAGGDDRNAGLGHHPTDPSATCAKNAPLGRSLSKTLMWAAAMIRGKHRGTNFERIPSSVTMSHGRVDACGFRTP